MRKLAKEVTVSEISADLYIIEVEARVFEGPEGMYVGCDCCS